MVWEEIWADKFTTDGGSIILHPRQLGDLMKDSQFINAYQYGGREVILNGELGRIGGLRVLISDEIDVASSKGKALLVGRHKDGTPAFGIALKASPRIETERNALERSTTFVATEEWDMQMLHANAVCTIETYIA